ncbi:uncharacterized protein LOC144091364 isoform X3 [Stigmatopora argus]
MDNGTTATRRLGLKLPLTFFMGFISSGEELFSLKEIQEEGANLVWQTFNLSLQETISAAQISFSTGAKLIPPRKGCSTPEAPRRRGAAIELRLVEEKIVFVQKEQQSVIQLFQGEWHQRGRKSWRGNTKDVE